MKSKIFKAITSLGCTQALLLIMCYLVVLGESSLASSITVPLKSEFFRHRRRFRSRNRFAEGPKSARERLQFRGGQRYARTTEEGSLQATRHQSTAGATFQNL